MIHLASPVFKPLLHGKGFIARVIIAVTGLISSILGVKNEGNKA